MAEDYRANEQDTARLFAEVQNKLFFAVTGFTAAELIVRRADAGAPNMNLLSFKGDRVRKADVVVAKNYLNAEELDQLNRLVGMFLDFAELRAEQRKHLLLADWRQYIDSFMAFNEQPLLRTAGSISHEQMQGDLVTAVFNNFFAKRHQPQPSPIPPNMDAPNRYSEQ
nr:virulence RhuM family protein [Pseudomonas protegens]